GVEPGGLGVVPDALVRRALPEQRGPRGRPRADDPRARRPRGARGDAARPARRDRLGAADARAPAARPRAPGRRPARGGRAGADDPGLDVVSTDRQPRERVEEILETIVTLAAGAAAQARSGALEPRPQTCTPAGTCAYPGLCRCEA